MRPVLCILVVIAATFVMSGTASANLATAQGSIIMCVVDENGECQSSGDYSDQDAGVAQNETYDFYVGCTRKSVWASRNYKAAWGYPRYRYFEQITWCYRDGFIYQFSRSRWAQTNWPWVFDGNVNNSCRYEDCSENVLTGYAEAMTQGHFHACTGQWVVCNDRYPLVKLAVNGWGGWGVYTQG